MLKRCCFQSEKIFGITNNIPSAYFLKYPLTKPVERQIPYTLFGLARAVRLSPEALLSVYRRPGRTQRERLLFDAVLRVAAYTQERALLGELAYQVALEALRTIGAPAEKEDGPALCVTLDERLARYAK